MAPPVCGILHNFPNSLLKLRDVQRLITCELGTASVCARVVPKENALRVNASSVVVPDTEMPEPPVSSSNRSFEILASPPHFSAQQYRAAILSQSRINEATLRLLLKCRQNQ